jgi:hypothetical protein
MKHLCPSCLAVASALLVLPIWNSGRADKKRSEFPVKAVLQGKATYDGDPPPIADLKPVMEQDGDLHRRNHFLKGDTRDQAWMIGANRGVQNVAVWLRSVDKKALPVPAELRKWTASDPTMDRPFGHYAPRVVILYPSYFDPELGKQQPTGQRFKFINTSPINSCPRWKGSAAINDGQNLVLRPGAEFETVMKPCRADKSGEDLVNFGCDRHDWMKAYAWVFDHPYAAVTRADGTYEIKDVPTDLEVEVVHWHESFGTKPKAVKMTLKNGVNEFSVKLRYAEKTR